jgi:Na+/melibiose symporter-like transporter
MQASGSTSWDLRSMLGYPGLFVIFALFTLFWLAIILIPYGKLLKRTGHPPVWCIVFAIPLVNLVALWIFAFKPWPTDKEQPLVPVTPVGQT